MRVGEKEYNCKSQISVCLSRMNMKALFIGTEHYPLLTAPLQIKRTFSLVAINVQQLRMFIDSILPGQKILQIKTVKDIGTVRRRSGIFRVQVLTDPTPRGPLEVTLGQTLRNDSKCSMLTPSLSARESFRVSGYSGIILSPNSVYSAQKLRKTK